MVLHIIIIIMSIIAIIFNIKSNIIWKKHKKLLEKNINKSEKVKMLIYESFKKGRTYKG
jgi:hypothetical protein